jgi:hypothetical protein
MSGFSSDAGSILDYASPRQWGKVRLPSQSRFELRMEPDGVIVHEWLQAKASAFIAMAIAVFTFVAMFVAACGNFRYHMTTEDRAFMLGVPAMVGVMEILVFLLVINNTWRRTTLKARRDSMMLTFVAPFGTRRYEWDASRIEDIRIRPTTTAEHRNSLGELEIRISGHSMVKLFTDHSAAELHELAGRLREAVGLGVSSARRPDLEASHEPDSTSQ